MNATKEHKTPCHCGCSDKICFDAPDFERPNFHYGMMLNDQHLRLQQSYDREKLKLHNRCLHGYGVVCGLHVTAIPPVFDPCEPVCEPKPEPHCEKEVDELFRELAGCRDSNRQEEIREAIKRLCLGQPSHREPEKDSEEKRRKGWQLKVDCGFALDCHGNDLVVKRPIQISIWDKLSPGNQKRWLHEKMCVYVTLCYCESGMDPVRTVVPDKCEVRQNECNGSIRESVRVLITTEKPPADERCETCCEPCKEECLWLARVCFSEKGELEVHEGIRRCLSTYPSTVITGINWNHAGYYSPEQARDLLADNGEQNKRGLEIRFSRPVYAHTITPGVLDVWVIEGGAGRAADIYHMDGEFVNLRPDSQGLVESLTYCQTSGESLQPGDRVLITLRTSFILDKCCRPVHGEHVGGRVPNFRDHEKKTETEICPKPPGCLPHWTSGHGAGGDRFESWFYIRRVEPSEKTGQEKKP
jgi:hypothetical protein